MERRPGTPSLLRELNDRAACSPGCSGSPPMLDERWHVKYVKDALAAMADRYGGDLIDDTLARYTAADKKVYAHTLAEYGERIAFLTQATARRAE